MGEFQKRFGHDMDLNVEQLLEPRPSVKKLHDSVNAVRSDSDGIIHV